LEIAANFLQSSQHVTGLLANLSKLPGAKNNQAQQGKEEHFR
jgi:hypothetical protein